jgi:hypothetical protein
MAERFFEDYWLLWPLGILAWLTLGILAFAFMEHKALRTRERPGEITLSFFTYTLSRKFPLAVFALYLVLGMLLGGLSVHFFWHWCPAGSASVGEVSDRAIAVLLKGE